MRDGGPEEQLRQALTLIEQGRTPVAERRLTSLCQQHPDDAKAWFLRGALRAEAGDTKRAIEYLSNAVRLAPANTQAHFTLCKLHHSLGNASGATHHAEQVVAQEPEHAHAWLALGSFYADSGQFPQAEKASRIAVELLPSVPEPRVNLANALISQGKHEEALVLCRQIKADQPRGPGILHSLGLAFRTLGARLDAEQCMETVLRLVPDDATAHCVLGQIKAAQGELSRALALYERAKALAPGDAMVHFQIGKALLPASSARHAKWVERLQDNHQFRDASEASDIARELVAGFRYGNSDVERVLVRFFNEFDPAQLYSTEWWADVLKHFGDRRHAADTALRSIFSAVFSFSLPCKQALDQLAMFCGNRIASYGSGSGYWEWLMANHYGIEVSCHDIVGRHRFLPTHIQSHADAKLSVDDAIFLAWVPGDTGVDVAIESLLNQAQPGQKLVVVGEPDVNGQPRTCGSQRFFRYLRRNFENTATLPLPNYAYLVDRVELMVKRAG